MEAVSKAMVYKIVASADWERACENGQYDGSADDRRDGFIHLSARHQLKGTLAKHYKGRDRLILAAFASEAFGVALRWEPSRGGDDFPHLYGPLPTASALWTKPLSLGDDGIPSLPPDLA